MQVYRFEHMGRVCSGDYLENQWAAEEPFLIFKGYFILVMICIIYGMIGLVMLSVLMLALTLKYSKENGRESFINEAMKSVLNDRAVATNPTSEQLMSNSQLNP